MRKLATLTIAAIMSVTGVAGLVVTAGSAHADTSWTCKGCD